jgi:hypothetical protein
VSRRHARIVRRGDDLVLQDLGSANGVYVNQERLTSDVVLHAGDQIFIGTCEIILYEGPPESDRLTESGTVSRDGERDTPISSINPAAVVYPSDNPDHPTHSKRHDSVDPEQSTQHAAGFEYLGRLADKMFTMGRLDAAKQILAGHLEDIVRGARRGRALEPRLVDSAGRYALRLAAETLESHWVDLAVELHILAHRPMLDETVQRLASLRAKAPIGDRDLLRKYGRILRGMAALLSPAERIIAERIICLEPDSDAS